ncbi:DNA translocase FtsK [Kordiimonas aquimaris]|uniref:DNA translocase FtsK n=1 Tax=Kordiimonas aquimaris TaxID=707591 RepID=UPI0021D274EB|nr:DNA translocase FtsK [Kordiimonas aquimaris]
MATAKKQAAKPRKPANKKARAPLLPEAVTVFFKNTGWRLVGGLFCGFAVAMALSVASYNPQDPALNTQNYAPVTNLLGEYGAIVADVLMQTLALASYLLVLPLFLWGVKVMRLKWLPLFWLNLAALPVGVILLSVTFSVIPPDPEFVVQTGYGGVIGQRLYSMVVGLMSGIIIPWWGYGLIFALLGLPAYLFSFALSSAEWRVFLAKVGAFVSWVYRLIVRGLMLVWTGLQAVFGALFRKASSEGASLEERIEPTVKPRKASSQPAAKPVAPVVAAKRVKTPPKTRRGRRETQEAQATLDLGDGSAYVLPPLDLLAPPPPPEKIGRISAEALEQNARMLEGVLDDFGVQGDVNDVRPGPVVTLYELEPARGVKSARVIGLADDIARSMSAISARVAVVPGRNAIGIELPNSDRQTVFLRELLASRDFESSKARLPIILGKDIGGEPVVADLASMPHLLVAGTTGSGKSVGVNTMIMSLLYRHSPETLRFIMVDPKMLELSVYDDIPHLLTPVVTEPKKAVVALKWAVREMEERYRNMSKLGVRNLAAFNKRVQEANASGERLARQVQTGFDKETGQPIIEEQVFDFTPLPFIVIVIDEMADLMLVAGKDVEATIQRLAQMARAAGIHLITATQRPSVDVITGTIKANFPTRISFQVTSKIDSRTILGEQGAEQLLGMGDMLFMAGGGRITRVHGAFVADDEVEDVVTHLKQQAAPDYLSSVTEEPEEGFDSPFIPGPSGDDKEKSLYDKAVDIVLRDRRASTSYIQRRLKIGYNKAATLIEDMEAQGVISGPNHKGQREILVPEREEEF